MSLAWMAMLAVAVLPVVLLFAFAGCEPFGTSEPVGTAVAGPAAGGPPQGDPVLVPTQPKTYAQLVTRASDCRAAWPLEPRPDNVAEDKGPYAPTFNAQYHNVGFDNGVIGSAAAFDGKLSSVALGHYDGRLNTPTFSVELWVKPASNLVGPGESTG